MYRSLKIIFSLIIVSLFAHQYNLYGTSVGQSNGNKSRLNFNGKLISHANPDKTITVINIGIGTYRDSAGHKITVYEKPDRHAPAHENAIKLEKDPEKLIEYSLTLDEIKKIEVPDPDILWTFQKQREGKKRREGPIVEFIELRITSVTSPDVTSPEKSTAYLLRLGLRDTSHRVKLFCDAIDGELAVLEHMNAGMDGKKNEQPKMCPVIDRKILREQGVSFQAIKELKIEGYCQKPVVEKNAGEE